MRGGFVYDMKVFVRYVQIRGSTLYTRHGTGGTLFTRSCCSEPLQNLECLGYLGYTTESYPEEKVPRHGKPEQD